jgi:hypothetical protein
MQAETTDEHRWAPILAIKQYGYRASFLFSNRLPPNKCVTRETPISVNPCLSLVGLNGYGSEHRRFSQLRAGEVSFRFCGFLLMDWMRFYR